MSFPDTRAAFNAQLQRIHAHGPDNTGILILDLLEVIMSAIEGLQSQFDDYKQTVADTFAAQDAALQSALDKITALQGSVTDPTQLQALTDDITQAKQVAQAELSKAQAASSGGAAPTGTPDPAGGTTVTPDPAGGTTPTGGGSADPSAPVGEPAAAQTVYMTTEDPSTIDTAVWSPASVQTAPTDGTPAQSLYTYVDDVNPGDQNGTAVAGWTVYTGPTQPVPGA